MPKGSLDVASEFPPSVRLAQLQAIFDSAPVGLAFLDRDLRYNMVNCRLAQLNGREMADHLGKTVPEMIPEFFPSVQQYIQRALDGETILNLELTKPFHNEEPAQTVLLSYAPVRNDEEDIVGVSVAVVDVTPIRQAQAARQLADENFRQMIELLPQIPWVIDAEGRALDVSQRWLELTGMTGEEWRGFGWLGALHPDDRQPTIDTMRRSFETSDPIDLTYRVRSSPTSNWQRVRSRGSPRVGSAGDIIGWYGCIEDTGEAELIHTSRVNAMGTMAATLAHELRQPLTAINNYVAVATNMIENSGQKEVIASALQGVKRASDRATDITRIICDLTGRRQPIREQFALKGAVEECISIIRLSASPLVEMSENIDEPIMLTADRVQIQQVIINLVRNAVDAVTCSTNRRVHISAHTTANDVVTCVSDTGLGISTPTISRLFAWNETKKTGGMGIGLSISRTIVEAHGGSIWLEHTSKDGSTFCFSVPKHNGSSDEVVNS